MRMSLRLRCTILLACLSIVACGPAVGEDDGPTTSGETSTGAASTTSPLSASTGAESMTETAEASTGGSSTAAADESSSGTTGPTEEPVGCYESNDPGDDQCCPELEQPCAVVEHECVDRQCSDAPFAGPVLDPMAAQCLLAALVESSPARLDQTVYYGFGGFHRQLLVSASGEVTLIETYTQDFNFEVSFSRCQLVDTAMLEVCAAEDDPQVLSDCLGTALVDCVMEAEPVCPG
jgi:hypothetical protein